MFTHPPSLGRIIFCLAFLFRDNPVYIIGSISTEATLAHSLHFPRKYQTRKYFNSGHNPISVGVSVVVFFDKKFGETFARCWVGNLGLGCRGGYLNSQMVGQAWAGHHFKPLELPIEWIEVDFAA